MLPSFTLETLFAFLLKHLNFTLSTPLLRELDHAMRSEATLKHTQPGSALYKLLMNSRGMMIIFGFKQPNQELFFWEAWNTNDWGKRLVASWRWF